LKNLFSKSVEFFEFFLGFENFEKTSPIYFFFLKFSSFLLISGVVCVVGEK